MRKMLKEIKTEAIKNNRAVVYNAINNFEFTENPEYLLRAIQQLSNRVAELEECVFQQQMSAISPNLTVHLIKVDGEL